MKLKGNRRKKINLPFPAKLIETFPKHSCYVLEFEEVDEKAHLIKESTERDQYLKKELTEKPVVLNLVGDPPPNRILQQLATQK
jgi:hypothetical protein